MKSIILNVIAIFLISYCYGQNWNCFVPGQRQYFTNSNGYLRGMRIDSVRTVGSDVVYYPLHTPRGMYRGISWSGPVQLDSTGGSWLGKNVIEQADGTFLFDNEWGDTVIIKTQAEVGDSWGFYNDTTKLYFRADVLSKDTMRVLSVLDSVKTIQITAYGDTGHAKKEPADSFTIIISKAHGFVQVFDLYTFPYHKPDSAYRQGLDYYLDKTRERIYSFGYSYGIEKKNSIFNLIRFVPRTIAELNDDWKVGDVFKYTKHLPFSPCNFGKPEWYIMDTIIDKKVVAGKLQIKYRGSAMHINSHCDDYLPPMPDSGSIIYENKLVIDTLLMPEEYRNDYRYYYLPDDSSFCYVNELFVVKGDNLLINTSYNPPFEGPWYYDTYKKGLGRIIHDDLSYDDGPLEDNETLICAVKSGMACGECYSLSIRNKENERSKIELTPNPAKDEVKIKFEAEGQYDIALINLSGQTVLTRHVSGEQCNLNVEDLHDGVYTIRVSDGRQCINQKLIVAH